MHARLITAALFGMLVSTAGAEKFYLKHDATGKVYGPYQTEAGPRSQSGQQPSLS